MVKKTRKNIGKSRRQRGHNRTKKNTKRQSRLKRGGENSQQYQILLIRHGFSKANYNNYGPESRLRSEASIRLRRNVENTQGKTGGTKQPGLLKQLGGFGKHAYMKDPPLDSQGVIESEAAGEKLRDRSGDNDFVLCSAMKRSIETALFMFPGKKVVVCPFLAENTGLSGRAAKIIGANRENTISDKYTDQLKNFEDRFNSLNNTDKYVSHRDTINRVYYAKGSIKNDSGKYTKDAGKGDIQKFLWWLNSEGIKGNKLQISSQGNRDIPEFIINPREPIPIVTHSHTISRFIPKKVKLANNQVIRATVNVGTENIEIKKGPCSLFKGYQHKK